MQGNREMKRGESCTYRAMFGDFYPATIIAANADGTVDISIDVRPPLELPKRPVHEGGRDTCPVRSVIIEGATK